MNDDELIERLRRTFQERAERLQPRPGHLPAPGAVTDAAAMRSDLRPAAAAGSGAPAPAPERQDRQTAEYAVLPPTGPVPVTGRRRWPALVVVGVVAAAAAVAAAVGLSGGRHPVTVRPVDNGAPSATVAPTVPGTPAGTPATTLPAKPVPAGFRPQSVTFVSAEDGWALGTVPGGAGSTSSCATLAQTSDGGRTWSEAGAPGIAGSCASTTPGAPPWLEVRFADGSDGWIWANGPGPSVPRPSARLWSTHDGGASWTPVALPLTDATVGDLEASAGMAHMVVFGSCPAGSPGCQGQTIEEILTSPVGADEWKPSPLRPGIGAGPVLSPALTLWGSTGWLINNNRTVVSGARLNGTAWTSWKPPCSSANGAGAIAASSSADLVAVCAEGTWGPPDPGTVAGQNWLFSSTNGGTSFSPVGQVPGNRPNSITVPPGDPRTVVTADGGGGLLASFDGGSTWATVEPGPSPSGTGGYVFSYVGFTTATQGVAVADSPAPALFMTRDGGHTWSPVGF